MFLYHESCSDEIDIDNCNLTEVIKFLQKIAKSPDASKLNIFFETFMTVGKTPIASYINITPRG